MVAVAIGVEARGIDDEADAGLLALQADADLGRAPAAAEHAGAHARCAFAGAREELDDTARVVTVHGGEGAAHHFDAFGGVEVEGGGLALAVRVAGGDAVGDQLDAAHAESGAGTEAAHRYLQVLGVVLAILDDQAGDAGQCLRGIHAEVARLVGAHVDRIDREG